MFNSSQWKLNKQSLHNVENHYWRQLGYILFDIIILGKIKRYRILFFALFLFSFSCFFFFYSFSFLTNQYIICLHKLTRPRQFTIHQTIQIDSSLLILMPRFNKAQINKKKSWIWKYWLSVCRVSREQSAGWWRTERTICTAWRLSLSEFLFSCHYLCKLRLVISGDCSEEKLPLRGQKPSSWGLGHLLQLLTSGYIHHPSFTGRGLHPSSAGCASRPCETAQRDTTLTFSQPVVGHLDCIMQVAWHVICWVSIQSPSGASSPEKRNTSNKDSVLSTANSLNCYLRTCKDQCLCLCLYVGCVVLSPVLFKAGCRWFFTHRGTNVSVTSFWL